jgi:hypothetical protein
MTNPMILIGISTVLLAAGCAKRPDAIAPVAINENVFSMMSCEQIAVELAAERNKLAALSAQQNQAATGDAVGVFLIGVPASSAFGGDKEGELAVSKGMALAMENAQRAKACAVS